MRKGYVMSHSHGPSPETLRLVLATELKRLRLRAALNVKQVAASLEWSQTKVSRIESGATSISVVDLRALLFLYDISDEDQISNLEAIARAAKQLLKSEQINPAISAMVRRTMEDVLWRNDTEAAIQELRSMVQLGAWRDFEADIREEHPEIGAAL